MKQSIKEYLWVLVIILMVLGIVYIGWMGVMMQWITLDVVISFAFVVFFGWLILINLE